jgi:DNA-binding XRE family transcriptional regulator
MTDLLKYYRIENGLAMEDVAFMLDIPVNEYTMFEDGKAELPLKLMVRLCHYFHIRLEQLMAVDKVSACSKPRSKSSEKQVDRLGSETHAVPETAVPTNKGDKDSDEWKIDWDKPRKKLTAKEAVEIYKKHGTEITEEEAEKVLEFLNKMAKITVDHVFKEAKWEAELREHPDGFLFEESGYSCRICKHGAKDGWYDRFGLKCSLCQQAVNKGIIPGEITGHDELYYSEFDLGYYFNLKGKTLRQWIKEGLLRQRTIPLENGKGKHYQIFLMNENERFLPPKEMLRLGGWFEEEGEDGKPYYVTRRWYQCCEDPIAHLKDYGISAYLRRTDGDGQAGNNEQPDSDTETHTNREIT